MAFIPLQIRIVEAGATLTPSPRRIHFEEGATPIFILAFERGDWGRVGIFL